MPVVVVEIASPEPARALADALLGACSAAIREGSCLRDPSPTQPSKVVAHVSFDEPDERVARVQLRVENGENAVPAQRELRFAETDPPVERWRSVGLAVATLAGPFLPPEPSPAPPAAPPPPEVPEPEPRKHPPPEPREPDLNRVWIGASGLLGPGLSTGGLRGGGGLDVGFRPASSRLFGRASVAALVSPADTEGLSVQWGAATLGGGVVVGGRELSVEPRVGVSFELVRASVSDPSGRTDSGTRTDVGVHGGVDGVLRFGDLSLVVSLEGFRTASQTSILVKRQPVGVSRQTSFLAGVGFRWFLF